MVEDADFIAYSDACLTGMGFYIPSEHQGYYGNVPSETPSEWIYYREMWGVLSALYHAVNDQNLREKKLIIYTDNTNTRDTFNTLAADPTYNPLVLMAADLLIQSSCQLRVNFVEGTRNVVADALSRHHIGKVLQLDLEIRLYYFKPPRPTLGANKK